MVMVLTILAYVAMGFRDNLRANHTPLDALASGLPERWMIAALMCGVFGLCAIAGHVACAVAGRQMDRAGNILAIASVERALLAVRLTAGAAFITALFTLDWLGVVRSWVGDIVVIDEFLCLMPLLAVFVVTWASAYPIERRLREATFVRKLDEGLPVDAGPTRLQSVLAHARQSLLIVLIPIMLVGGWRECVDVYVAWYPPKSETQATAIQVVWFIGTILLFIVSPLALRVVWASSTIGAGELRDMLVRVAKRYRVRMGEPLVWHTHGSMMNGAVLGVVWPFRYLLLTDLLLERLQPREVEAVAAHEFGHIRHKHMLWLAVSSIGAVLFTGMSLELVLRLFATTDGVVIEGLRHGVPLICGALVFGWVSRRFEWQADAFAVRHLSETFAELNGSTNSSERATGVTDGILPQGSHVMQSALRQVAHLNGVDPTRFTFRHGSIDERTRRMRQLVGIAPTTLPIDRIAFWIKVWASLLFVGSIGGVILEEWLAKGR
jgi:STE24 endopeptidase